MFKTNKKKDVYPLKGHFTNRSPGRSVFKAGGESGDDEKGEEEQEEQEQSKAVPRKAGNPIMNRK